MTGSRLSPSAIFLSSSPQSYNLPPSFVLYEPLSSLSVRIRLLRWLRPVTVPIIIVAVAFDYWKAVPFRNFLVNLEVFLSPHLLYSTQLFRVLDISDQEITMIFPALFLLTTSVNL